MIATNNYTKLSRLRLFDGKTQKIHLIESISKLPKTALPLHHVVEKRNSTTWRSGKAINPYYEID
jgi:hypothetical protein